jgi:hypothetical protein
VLIWVLIYQRYEPPKSSPRKTVAKEKEAVMKGDQKPKAYKVMVTEAITTNASRKVKNS